MNKFENKVLVVCMLDSVHTARWLRMFKDQPLEFILFPSTPNRKVHPEIRKLIGENSRNEATFSLDFYIDKFAIPIWLLGKISKLKYPAQILKKVAFKNAVSQIHAIELNHAGYLVSKAFELGLPKDIRIISTNWGSDIYWFRQFPKHKKQLQEILRISNLYTAECVRDLKLATDLGYSGEFGEVLPNAGGFDLEHFENPTVPPSHRKAIVIKGYESFVGRASMALAAVEKNAKLLSGFEILIYSANRKTIKIANKLENKTGLKISTFPKKSLSHKEVLELFKKSRIYIGISLSDAISTSLLEAMISGTYPIQTDTSCAEEWIESGISGSIVKPEVSDITTQLRKALTDDKLVNDAATINLETSKSRLNSRLIEEKLKNFYNSSNS